MPVWVPVDKNTGEHIEPETGMSFQVAEAKNLYVELTGPEAKVQQIVGSNMMALMGRRSLQWAPSTPGAASDPERARKAREFYQVIADVAWKVVGDDGRVLFSNENTGMGDIPE